MSQAEVPVTLGDCAHVDCVDQAVVRIEYRNGECRVYCEHHARHITPVFPVEVIDV